jgi:hypothetical protein
MTSSTPRAIRIATSLAALFALAACHPAEPQVAEIPPLSETPSRGAEAPPPDAVVDPGTTSASGRFCGGIAAMPCPGAGVCVDAPDDGCDPNHGGADCGGVCRCESSVLCSPGTRFDASPDVCACVAAEAPHDDVCARVRCMGGTHCVSHDGRAECVPAGAESQ